MMMTIDISDLPSLSRFKGDSNIFNIAKVIMESNK